MSAATPTLELTALRFSWPEEPGLAPFHLGSAPWRLGPGEAAWLRGPSGAGKSTLLGLLAGRLLPEAGEVRVAGRAWGALGSAERRAWRLRQVGQLLQEAPTVPYLDARANVALPLRLAGIRDEAVVDELIEAVGLGSRARHRPAALSVGERRRLALARALVTGAPLVLADEPTAGLDAPRAREVLDLLFRRTVERGGALVVVSHDDLAARSWQLRLVARYGEIAPEDPEPSP